MPSWKPNCLKASQQHQHHHHLHSNNNHINNHHQSFNFSSSSSTSKISQGDPNECHYNSNILNPTSSNDILNNEYNFLKQFKQQQLQLQNQQRQIYTKNSTRINAQKSYSVVELHRLNGSQFGLTISGGTDKEGKPRICDLKPGSIAHRSDELQVGDLILSINGIKTQGLKHEEIIEMIKNADDTLRLEIEYNLPPWPIHPPNAVRSQTVNIQLEKEHNLFGFTIRGGVHDDKSKSRPLIVTNIRAGGPADREGTLKIGDRIIAINGINVVNANLHEAYCIMKQCKGAAIFLIEYDSAIVDSIKNSNGPLLIEIEKSPGSSIGIKLNLAKGPNGKNQILVESVKPASIADRCGAIFVGDQILSIDDISFDSLTLAEANQILKNCTGEFSRVEILPLSQMNSRPSSCKSSINSCGLSSTTNTTNQVNHSESVDVTLVCDDTGTFGFTLQAGPLLLPNSHLIDPNTSTSSHYPVIGYIEPNSSAEKSGVMQPGDRVLSINGRSLDNLNLDEARQLIKESGTQLNLEIEFDVADNIMLTSGIFQVKLIRKNLDIGLTVVYPRFLKADEYPLISDVKKGGVAYRSGMLQPGDRLMFIDHISLRGKSINEINQLLKNTDEVVKLKIKKDEIYTEDNVDEKTVVYTVEMQRNGGPLGITISGSDEPFDPIYVSGLTEGGLAERTQAIHTGDIILAINNVSLRGKTLAEAIDLLRNADDTVTLKISRQISDSSVSETLSSRQPRAQLTLSSSSNHLINNSMTSVSQNSSAIYGDYNNKPKIVSNDNQTPSTANYFPFPLDMSNFMNIPNHNSFTNQKDAEYNLRKKVSSLDSINAVERELDEVLRDLEMNSNDLNIASIKDTPTGIELPITVQTPAKISSSSFLNSNQSLNKTNSSEFISGHNRPRRQNIVSTYEYCQECYDNDPNHTNCKSRKQIQHDHYEPQLYTQNLKISENSNPEVNQSYYTSSTKLNPIPETSGKPPIAVRVNKNVVYSGRQMVKPLNGPRMSVEKTLKVNSNQRSRSIPTHSEEMSKEDGKPPVPPQNSTLGRPRKIETSSITLNTNGRSSNCKYSKQAPIASDLCELTIDEGDIYKSNSTSNASKLAYSQFKDIDATSSNSSTTSGISSMKQNSTIDDRVEIIVNKDHRFGDFGFSISDSLYGKGIYINKVRSNSINPYLKPYTQIYQINNIDTTNMDCSQVYKLLSIDQSNDRMRLVLSKRPKPMEKLYTDEQQSSNTEDNSRLTRVTWDEKSNGPNLGAIGGCRTTAL